MTHLAEVVKEANTECYVFTVAFVFITPPVAPLIDAITDDSCVRQHANMPSTRRHRAWPQQPINEDGTLQKALFNDSAFLCSISQAVDS